ncbi:hypothetical protein P4J10_23170 [Bacillus cereus]|uniref:hypothetical protein n=1 Tax=Bacillus cereus group TaxID=86661 RepID=UPI000B45309F|nr:hypothetical protein [Bacillus thuringiensis]MEB9469497.1 hypothetical protein [Bacillus cereus]MRA82294.1 hypothetical protein [Bacillus thuringiensis]OUA18973.1 hypothetical protein BK776_28045 [Bacillus thuringiensis serovar aizawai]
MINTVWSKYRVEFGFPDGRKGAYLGDTIEELHNAIDSDKRLENDMWLINSLKYGYFWEFQDKPYETKEYTIDNCMGFLWTVR